jgi:signal transduction histidine kinase
VLPDRGGSAVVAVLDQVRATGEPREISEQPLGYRRPDGVVETRYFNAAFQPLREADGSIDDIIGVVSDVTEQVAARRALEEAHAAAEEVSRAKDDFLRIASHELRTPLTPILGWAQILLKTGAVAKEAQRGLEIIVQSAQAEARIVEDLIDVSHITAGKMRMEMRPVDLAAIVGACVAELEPAAAAKGVALDARIAPEAPISGDAHRLRRVVRGLLSNALKFTPRGGKVSVELTRDHRSHRLAVRDTGKGIAESELPHVFDPFHSGDPSTTRREGGLGLGMSIVRHIVEAHGGTVRAESEGRGRGATFVAELPAPRAERAVTPEQASGPAVP